MENLQASEVFPDSYQLMKEAVRVAPGGLVMEFGVGCGTSLRGLHRLAQGTVYGFDSFDGLPENWETQNYVHHPVGHFACEVPAFDKGIVIVKGLFQDTLENFLENHPGQAAFVHIDSDLYSSAKYVLTRLKDRIKTGTVIQFDELYNSELNMAHEWAAWNEFLEETQLEYVVLGRSYHAAAFQIT